MSIKLTMFVWLRSLRILISRIAVIGKPLVSFSIWIFFNATIWDVALSEAMKTALWGSGRVGEWGGVRGGGLGGVS